MAQSSEFWLQIEGRAKRASFLHKTCTRTQRTSGLTWRRKANVCRFCAKILARILHTRRDGSQVRVGSISGFEPCRLRGFCIIFNLDSLGPIVRSDAAVSKTVLGVDVLCKTSGDARLCQRRPCPQSGGALFQTFCLSSLDRQTACNIGTINRIPSLPSFKVG